MGLFIIGRFRLLLDEKENPPNGILADPPLHQLPHEDLDQYVTVETPLFVDSVHLSYHEKQQFVKACPMRLGGQLFLQVYISCLSYEGLLHLKFPLEFTQDLLQNLPKDERVAIFGKHLSVNEFGEIL